MYCNNVNELHSDCPLRSNISKNIQKWPPNKRRTAPDTDTIFCKGLLHRQPNRSLFSEVNCISLLFTFLFQRFYVFALCPKVILGSIKNIHLSYFRNLKFVFSVLNCSSSVFCILALGSGQRLLYRLVSGLVLVLVLGFLCFEFD